MIAQFGRALASEWLKRRRSLTTWLVLGSTAFVPSIIVLSRFRRIEPLRVLQADPRFWELLWRQAWEAMALMILPLAVMLMVSLITQIEDRNNAWKQVHAAPLSLPVIFVSKLTVILALAAALVFLYAPAVFAAGVLPGILLPSLPLPTPAFPLAAFLWRSLDFFVDLLPVVALQYLLALRFRTFVAPLAIGMVVWILAVGTVSWHYNFVIPYAYAGLDYLSVEYNRHLPLPASPRVIAAGWFAVLTMVGYGVYAARRDKG